MVSTPAPFSPYEEWEVVTIIRNIFAKNKSTTQKTVEIKDRMTTSNP